eukprot:Gregarina_sp_Poly_1__9105@NODE_558_length_7531_cov_98_785102_g439_i0_p12_GENE_NODE_558_length_7531_cov_98_785102_g439_i0NODE_558_length_7531_cov_98_785102_g439_i0_p12_ORF_typecomplete_len103_score12_04_NODE_558_length_7531_cov_98_785102_g439_i015921900
MAAGICLSSVAKCNEPLKYSPQCWASSLVSPVQMQIEDEKVLKSHDSRKPRSMELTCTSSVLTGELSHSIIKTIRDGSVEDNSSKIGTAVWFSAQRLLEMGN